jgi:hypothetical protein
METVALVRVINLQVLPRSILLDKIDRTSGQFETDITYAQTGKQAVYVPQKNPIDPTVNGYIDLVPTDEVLLQVNQPDGVIVQLADAGYVSYFAHSGTLTQTPVISASAPVVAKSGTAGNFAASVGSSAAFTDAVFVAGFASTDVGSPLTVSVASVPANEGTYEILSDTNATTVELVTSTALVETANTDTWSTPGGLPITGTTFLSLTPDHTYVILTNATGGVQTITDTAIIAAKGMVSATRIFVPESLIVGGPATSSWKVQIMANSKLSNVFSVT